MDLYKSVLFTVLEQGNLSDAEKMALTAIRDQLGLQDFHHEEALLELGWSVERFQGAIDHHQKKLQYRAVLRECLIHSALIQDREVIDKFRVEHSITDQEHEECLHDLGWTVSEYASFSPGIDRAIQPVYQDLIRRALLDEYLSEAEDAAIKAFRAKHGISEAEHEKALETLGVTPEIYNAKRAMHARRDLKRTVGANAELDTQIEFLTQRLAAQHQAGQAACSRIQELEESNVKLNKQEEEVEDELVALRKEMGRLDQRLTQIKDFIENKDEISRTLTTETFDLEAKVKVKNAEVKELAGRIETLTSHLQEKQQAVNETSEHATRVLHVMQHNANVAMPKNMKVANDEQVQEERGKRMFRTAVTAIKSAILTRHEADTLPLNVDAMYEEMTKQNLGISDWKDYITEKIHMQKLEFANPHSRKAGPASGPGHVVAPVEASAVGTQKLVSAIGISPS